MKTSELRTWDDVALLVEEFVQKYPDEEYGFAHIVLSDQNLENVYIDYCLTHQSKYEDRGHTNEVIEFLNFLKTIPETIRESDDE